ncbi:MAG: NADPH-dependent F420 reductase [Usitatibacter sp.]
MKPSHATHQARRNILNAAAAIAASLAFTWFPLDAQAADGAGPPMKIGIIGSGRIGGTLGELWAKAGHEVMFSSLDLEQDKALAAKVGARARAGTPAEAAAYGDVLLVSVPYKALPQLGRDLAGSIKGKVVLDTCNPIQARDGEMAIAAREKGTGVASAELLPGARLVRAFNEVGYAALRSETNRAGEKVAIPLAADDKDAMQVAIRLVKDAGFEPVVMGALSTARTFDVGTAVFGKALTAKELREKLGIGK